MSMPSRGRAPRGQEPAAGGVGPFKVIILQGSFFCLARIGKLDPLDSRQLNSIPQNHIIFDRKWGGGTATREPTFRQEGVAMVDLLIWTFFGAGFIVMIVMIVSVFRAIWEGRKEREIWKGLSGKLSTLKK
jgi:hypothetical protein